MIQSEGYIDAENYSVIFRTIAQKRQNGWLMLTNANKESYIGFYNGKIIDVGNRIHRRGLEQLIENLVDASILKKRLDVSELSTYEDLYKVFINNKSLLNIEISEGLMKALVKELVLDVLFSVEFGGSYRMSTELITHDRYFNPFITVGQYLLDKVVFDNGEWTFKKLFPEGCLVRRTAKVPEILTDEERRIFNVTRTPTSIPQIKRMALLSVFTIHEALLSLHSSQLIETVDGGPATPRPTVPHAREEDSDYFGLLKSEPVNLTNITNPKPQLDDFVEDELPDNIAKLIQDTSLGNDTVDFDFDLSPEMEPEELPAEVKPVHQTQPKRQSASSKIEARGDSGSAQVSSKQKQQRIRHLDRRANSFDEDLFETDTEIADEDAEENLTATHAVLSQQISFKARYSLEFYLLALTITIVSVPFVRFFWL